MIRYTEIIAGFEFLCDGSLLLSAGYAGFFLSICNRIESGQPKEDKTSYQQYMNNAVSTTN